MVRLLNAAEVELILPLSKQVNDLHVAAMPDVFRDDAAPSEVAGFFQDHLSKGARIFVSEQAGQVVGYLLAIPVDRPKSPFQHATRYIELDQISVDAAHRGQGIGKALVQAMEVWMRARGVSQWKSNVYGFNTASNALMAGQGADQALHRYIRTLG